MSALACYRQLTWRATFRIAGPPNHSPELVQTVCFGIGKKLMAIRVPLIMPSAVGDTCDQKLLLEPRPGTNSLGNAVKTPAALAAE
jgi:hypothetical protein